MSETEEQYFQKHYYELLKAFKKLPEIPSVYVLSFLGSVGKFPEDYNKGVELRNKHGLDLIPPKTEYEIGAGVWFRFREALTKK